MDKLNRPSFQTAEFQLQSSTETPKIKAGGSSSSNLLNRFFTAFSQDLALFITRLNSLVARADRLEDVSKLQGLATVGLFNTLASKVDAASGYSQILADMHSDFYVDTTYTTADIDKVFGQATLPITSQTDLLVQTDVYGNKYISNEIEFSYVETTSSTTTPPSNGLFTVDNSGLYMIRGDQSWVHATSTGKTRAFVKLKAPLQFRGLTPNVLEIWPMPAGVGDLIGVWYQEAGTGADGTWTSVDITYLPGYTTTPSAHVDNFGPIRIHLPNDPVAQICFAFDLNSATTWGVYDIKLYNVQYETTATLVVKDPYSRTLGSLTLRGKDPSDLSTLSVAKTGNQAQVTLTSTDYSKTPVITGVIIAVT